MPHALLALVFFWASLSAQPAQTGAPAAEANADEPKLTADEPLEINLRTREVVATGNATLTDGTFRLRADSIRYSRATGEGLAEGNVIVFYPGVRLVAERVRYFSEEERFEAENVRMGRDPFYLEGPRLTGQGETITLESGTFHVGEPDPFTPNLRFEGATWLPDERVRFDNASFRVGQVPFFYLDGFTRSFSEEPTLRLKTEFGFRNNLGAFVRNTALVPVADGLRAGALLDGYTSRGVLFGPALDYAFDDVFGGGNLRAGYIDDNDAVERGVDILGAPVEERRYFVRWRHLSNWGDRVSFAGSLDWWSDSEVTREYRPDFFDESQQPDTFFESVYRGENFFISAFARPQTNDFFPVDQRLPEVRFALLPTPLLRPELTQQAFASYTRLRNIAPGGPDLESDRFDAYYGWRYAWTPQPWFTFTPLAGGRVTHYADTLPGVADDDFTRLLGQVGFDAELRVMGRWNTQSERWGIRGLRHQMKPIVQYRYIPEAQSGADRIAPIDDNTFFTYLEPLDLANRRDIDDLFEENVIRFGVENLLQTRREDYGSRDLIELNLYQDYRFTTRPGEDDYSETHVDFRLHPAGWLDAGVYSRFDSEHLTLDEVRAYVVIKDGDRWRILFLSESLQRTINQFLVEGAYRIDPRSEVYARWRYDARRNEFTEQTYGIARRLGSAWRVGFETSFQSGSTRESSVQVNFRIDLVAL
ncbi:MAG: LPS-assembly protein LptD [Opitutales bacterium]